MAQPETSFTVDSLPVRVFSNAAELVNAAVAEAQLALQAGLAARGQAAAILATGNSQLQFLAQLVTLTGVDWSRITLFHMDEYLGLSAGHPASFRFYMRQHVTSRLKVKAFHFLAGDALEPIQECDRYTALLRAQPIDLCCLGVGANGHLAFNDPPVADFNDPRWVKLVGLDETNRRQQAGYGFFKSLDDVPQYALTLTIPALMSAQRLLCLAPGNGKAPMLKTMLRGPVAPSCPASALRHQAQGILLLDKESASML
jgi:glucosamine-6-phosphate deaminase